jgi:hypothetical protein
LELLSKRNNQSPSLFILPSFHFLQHNRIRSQKKYKRRTVTVRPQAQHEALQAARCRQQLPAFAKEYALREGIEATISQGVRAFDMRRSRYVALPKRICNISVLLLQSMLFVR